ncbi:MAG: tetratricopeptide repeat protein [Chloroflexi bacterium]|nr:tetratricopeptide repeat protein [Chloroflexota bacterium]
MNQTFGLRQTLILLLLLTIILAPRPLAGAADLDSARRFEAAGDYAAAASAYAAAAARIPWRAGLCGQAGQAFWLAGDAGQAIFWFAKGESRQALSLSDWLAYGDALAALGDEAAAIRAWEQSLQIDPSAGAYLRLAQASRRGEDLPQAIEYLYQALALAPEDAEAHYQLGLLLAATAPEKALPELMRAAALDPEMDETVQALRAELNRAFLVEDRAYQFTVSGRALAFLGEWDLAAEAFRRAIEADAEYAEAWAWLGEARQQQGQDGRTQLARALLLEPQSASIQALDGLYWMRQGKPEKALAAYEKAAALEPENSVWQVSLGDAASASGDLLTASQHYRRAVELAPEDPAAWRALALFSLENDTDVENTGLVAARQLLRLAPDDWLTYDIAGRIAIRIGAQVEAETHLLKAIELAPQEPASHFHLALAYLESGQNSQAYDKLVDTLALDPAGPFGWQANRLLEQYFP